MMMIQPLIALAKKYSPEAKASIARNAHMHGVKIPVERNISDAVIVDFINFIGNRNGIDLGFYAEDLREGEIVTDSEALKQQALSKLSIDERNALGV